MFSARGVALKVTTVSVQLRVLHNSVYISARLKLPGTNSRLHGVRPRVKALFSWARPTELVTMEQQSISLQGNIAKVNRV
jgi:hypothetical protein